MGFLDRLCWKSFQEDHGPHGLHIEDLSTIFHVVSLVTDKSRTRKNQSFYRRLSSAGLCLTLRCDVGTSPGLCLLCVYIPFRTQDRRQTQQLPDLRIWGFLWSWQTLLFMWLSPSLLLHKYKLFHRILGGWICCFVRILKSLPSLQDFASIKFLRAAFVWIMMALSGLIQNSCGENWWICHWAGHGSWHHKVL